MDDSAVWCLPCCVFCFSFRCKWRLVVCCLIYAWQECIKSTRYLHGLLRVRAAAVVNADVAKCVAKATGHAVGREKLSSALSVGMDESEGKVVYDLGLQCPG